MEHATLRPEGWLCLSEDYAGRALLEPARSRIQRRDGPPPPRPLRHPDPGPRRQRPDSVGLEVAYQMALRLTWLRRVLLSLPAETRTPSQLWTARASRVPSPTFISRGHSRGQVSESMFFRSCSNYRSLCHMVTRRKHSAFSDRLSAPALHRQDAKGAKSGGGYVDPPLDKRHRSSPEKINALPAQTQARRPCAFRTPSRSTGPPSVGIRPVTLSMCHGLRTRSDSPCQALPGTGEPLRQQFPLDGGEFPDAGRCRLEHGVELRPVE